MTATTAEAGGPRGRAAGAAGALTSCERWLLVAAFVVVSAGCDGSRSTTSAANSNAAKSDAANSSAASSSAAGSVANGVSSVMGSASPGTPDASALAICEQAAERYTGCMEKLLGEEAGALARSKRGAGIPACARDAMTVTMYRTCLPKDGCAQFQECMLDFAKHTDPEQTPPAP